MSRPRAARGRVIVFDPAWARPIADFTHWLVAVGTASGTVRLQRSYVGRFSTTVPGGPQAATAEAVVMWLARQKWKPETRKSARTSLRRFFGWAHASGIIMDDPTRGLPPVRVPPGRPRPAPEQVIAETIAAALPRERSMLMLAAYEGLRCCEIARVHSEDIAEGWLYVTGKGGRMRAVPLHPLVHESLPARDGWLYPGQIDGHLSAGHVCRLLSRVLPAGWTAHTLRHRFGSATYSVERDLLAVQQLLGHASVRTTQIYVQIPGDALTRAVLAAGPTIAA